MNLDKYQLKGGQDLLTFEFINEGPKGLIHKQIQFTDVMFHRVFNLGFGDKNPVTGEIDDLVVSDNGDREKVIATIVSAVDAFCNQHPKVWIYVSGSTQTRTRLYRIGLSKYYEEIGNGYEIFGLYEEIWEPFEKEERL